MRNTMDVSYRKRVYQDVLKEYEAKKSQKSTKNFSDKVSDAILDKVSDTISDTNSKKGTEKREEQELEWKSLKVENVSVKDMTLEEYKQYIYYKISQLPMHPANWNDFVAVQITDAGFRAMQADPEYEKWVLDTLQNGFLRYDPWGGSSGKYVIYSFGASKEAYRVESWRMDGQNEWDRYNRKAENNFWERRAKRRKQRKEEYEKLLKKRLLDKKLYEKKVYEKKLQQKQYEEGVAKSKVEAKRQSEEWYHNKQVQALAFYEKNVIMETVEGTNFIG